jgi:hypothetical protein
VGQRSWSILKEVFRSSLPALSTIVLVCIVDADERVSIATHSNASMFFLCSLCLISCGLSCFHCAGCLLSFWGLSAVGQRLFTPQMNTYIRTFAWIENFTTHLSSACSWLINKFNEELDKFINFLFKPGQMNIVDSLVTVRTLANSRRSFFYSVLCIGLCVSNCIRQMYMQ